MKNILFLILLTTCFAACKNPPATSGTTTGQEDTMLNSWLETHKISVRSISDTIAEYADSIWDYTSPLSRTDSLYRWYPSTDSSYYLLTNIDRSSRQSIFKEGDDIEYRFLNTKTKKVYIGITLLNEGPLTPIDIFWQGPHTIYLLEQVKVSKALQLIKLDMQKDSIWSYKTTVQMN
jgi:hypothetical protein